MLTREHLFFFKQTDKEDAPDTSFGRQHLAPALFAGDAGSQLLEYKVLGMFKMHEKEEAKLDTYWLSIKGLVEAGAAAAEVSKMVKQYEQKYLAVSRAHWAAAHGPDTG